MKQKNYPKQIYKPGIILRLFMMGMGLFMAGLHAFVLREMPFSEFDAFTLLIFGLILLFDAWFVWYGYIFTTQTSVLVDADGIELQRGGSRLFTAWENISNFGIRGSGKHQQRGIYLYHKVKPEVDGLAERLIWGKATDFIPIGQAINLPREWGLFNRKINLEKLADTDFGRSVSLYAPHLLHDFNEKHKPSINRLLDRSSEATFIVGADSRKLRKHS